MLFSSQSTVLLFTFLLTSANAASFGELCGSDSDCTDVNTECLKFLQCEAGTCSCTSGFGNSNGNGCDKILKSFDETCGTDSYCNGPNQECSSTSGRCACTEWNTYNGLERGCVTVTYKVLTESCGGWWQEQCLVQNTDGGTCDSSSSTCRCATGYVMDTSESFIACRAPRYGEGCISSPVCTITLDTTTLSDDLSSDPPTCNQNVCQCPPSHDHKVVLGHNLCLVSVEDDTTLKENGDSCTSFNECKSSLCVKCTNTTSGVCMQEESGSSSFMVDSNRWIVSVIQLATSSLILWTLGP